MKRASYCTGPLFLITGWKFLTFKFSLSERKLISKLTRVTSSGQFIPEVDGLRFFAIITVVFYHLNTHFLRLTENQWVFTEMDSFLQFFLVRGGLGVQVFFTISGFILALPFANHYLNKTSKISLKKYYLRRLTRLEPTYIITLTIFLFVHIIYFNAELIRWRGSKHRFILQGNDWSHCPLKVRDQFLFR